MSSPTLARRLRHAGLTLVRTDVTPRHGIQPQAAPAGLGPADLQSAYALPSSSAGSGQTVAIVDAYDDPNAESDLATYRSQYGLPPCTSASGCFKKVDQTGGSSLPTADAGWAEEESLDLDMVSAVCPSCHILLVEASQPSMSDLGTAVNTAISLGAKYVSNSYGGSEDSTDPGSDSSYFNHPGVAITVSSGDSGYGAEYPAASQYVTAVGGTSLSRASNTRGWTESAWSGAGSGCSAYDTYQTGGWLVVGGTSASAPIIAGTYALAGPPASGTYAASSPYAHSSALYDITSGNNGSCSPAYLCTAGAGYDGPTGLGTPKASPRSAAAPAAAVKPSTPAATSPGSTGTAPPTPTAPPSRRPSPPAAKPHSACGCTSTPANPDRDPSVPRAARPGPFSSPATPPAGYQGPWH